MSGITDFNKCKKILQNDFNNISDINKLLEYKVSLIDSYNFAFRYEEFGTIKDSLERGFIIPVEDSGAKGYTAKDPFLSVNIQEAIKNIDSRLDYLYFKANEIDFIDLVQKNEADLKIAENNKLDYEDDEVITLEELGRNISVELAIIMFKCGLSYILVSKHNSIEEYKEELKNVLDQDMDIDEIAETINTNYDDLINQIECAKENLEKVEMFKIRDFYCVFKEIEDNKYNKIELNVYIKEQNDFEKVNTIFISLNKNIEEIKEIVNYSMCREIGKILENGKIIKEYEGQGYIYKNYENYYKREGICYVSEYDGDTIGDAGISYSGILEEVCDYLVLYGVDITKVPDRIIKGMVDDVFENVDWQSPSSLIMGDEYLSGYVEEFPEEYFREDAPENTENESR